MQEIIKKPLGILFFCLVLTLNFNAYSQSNEREIDLSFCKKSNESSYAVLTDDLNNECTLVGANQISYKEFLKESKKAKFLCYNQRRGTVLTRRNGCVMGSGHTEISFSNGKFFYYQTEKTQITEKETSQTQKVTKVENEPSQTQKVVKGKTHKPNNKDELQKYLLEKNLVLKQTKELGSKYEKPCETCQWEPTPAWLDKIKKPSVYTFKTNVTGNIFHTKDNHEMKFIWKSLSKNSFSYKHPRSPYKGIVVTLDFENNTASSKSEFEQAKYQILPDFDFNKFAQIKNEKYAEDKLREKYAKILDDEFINKKDGKMLVMKIISEIDHCNVLVKLQLSSLSQPVMISSISQEVNKWKKKAQISLKENNVQNMRVSIGQLRYLARELSKASKMHMGDDMSVELSDNDNKVAKDCKSIDDEYKIYYSTKSYDVWKKKYLSN